MLVAANDVTVRICGKVWKGRRVDINPVGSIAAADRSLEPARSAGDLDPGEQGDALIEIQRRLIVRSAHDAGAVLGAGLSSERSELAGSAVGAESTVGGTRNARDCAGLIEAVERRAE